MIINNNNIKYILFIFNKYYTIMNFEKVIDCFNNAKNSIDGRYTFSHITEYGLLKTIHFIIERTHLENEYFILLACLIIKS